jgi:hypothetical protein
MARGRRPPDKITVLPPDVVPLSDHGYQTAVSALARMIGQWWDREYPGDRGEESRPTS